LHNVNVFFGISLALILVGGSLPFSAFADDSLSVIETNVYSNSEKFVPGQVVIGLNNHDPFFNAKISNRGGQVVNTIEKINAFVIQVPEGTESKFISSMSKNPNVAYVERDVIVNALGHYPNDSFFDEQWGLQLAGMSDVWHNYSVALGSDVIVAVVDTGVYDNHPDLDGKILQGYDFVDNDSNTNPGNVKCVGPGGPSAESHGSFVSGIIGATTNNEIGIAGFGPKIMPVRVLGTCGSGSSSDVAAGIVYAADNGAHVINLSLGSSTSTNVEKTAVTNAYNSGVIIVAAAGNSGESNNVPSFPASYPEVISVSAVDRDSGFAPYSQWVDTNELAAFGGVSGSCQVGDVTTALSTGAGIEGRNVLLGYYCATGTSFASPHVAGVAALLRSDNPGATNQEIREHLQITATDLGAPGKDVYFGYGLVNAFEALNRSLGQPPDPSVNVSLSSDKTTYLDTENIATLTAVVTDENNDPISGLSGVSFSTTLDGSTSTVTFTESLPLGTYDGSLDITGLFAGSHDVTVTVTDAGLSGQDTISISIQSSAVGVDITGITPQSGSKSDSFKVTIFGTELSLDTVVTLENGSGPAPVIVIQENHNGSILGTMSTPSNGPPKNTTWDVRVTNLDESTDVLLDAFTMTASQGNNNKN
jgi:subtilisin family serine protease